MTEGVVTVVMTGTMSQTKPGRLRYVKRSDPSYFDSPEVLVLQQEWHVLEYDKGEPIRSYSEWRDVPVEDA